MEVGVAWAAAVDVAVVRRGATQVAPVEEAPLVEVTGVATQVAAVEEAVVIAAVAVAMAGG